MVSGLILLLIPAAVAGWWLFRHRQQVSTSSVRESDIREYIERAMTGMIMDWPEGSDEEVAQLTRDLLVTRSMNDPEMVRIATSETAKRARKSLDLAMTRGGVMKTNPTSSRPARPIAIAGPKKCPLCRADNSSEAYECEKCQALFLW